MNSEIKGFVHCRQCATRGQTQRLKVGLTTEGLLVQCTKHGLVGHFTPETLGALLSHPPECDCCKGMRGAPS